METVRINDVNVWIDGACSGNPGPGGWAFLAQVDTKKGLVEKMVGGSFDHTTNNQMEAMALQKVLLSLKYGCNVTVFTDSRNLIQWLSAGWKRKDAEMKLVLDAIDDTVKERGHKLTFVKVKAHSGDANNERVDKEAVRYRDLAKTQ